MSPMNLAGNDSEISDDDERGASAVHKVEGYVDPKHGFKLPLTQSRISLVKVTSLAEEDINTSDEDSLAGSYPVARRVEKSQEVGFFKSRRDHEDAIWYEVNQEAEALFQSTGCSSHRYTCKAKQGKMRPNMSLHSHAFGEEKSHSLRGCGYFSNHEELESDGEYPQGHENAQDHRSIKDSAAVAFKSFQPEKKLRVDTSGKLGEIISVQGGYAEHSAVELLENLQNKNVLLEDDPDKFQYAGYKRKLSLSEKKISFTLGDRSLNNEDPSEPICSTSSSDEDDESKPNLMVVATEATEKTMADRFQEALGTSILNDQGMPYAFSKPLGLGLSGKLQKVMQDEKDHAAHFLTIRQSIGQTQDESSCLDVKILSRYLEGKLIVCRCSLTDLSEGLADIPETVKENKDPERVLIFNFRICNDVNLDVGSCVRVHSPWKEVTTARYGVVTLCSYFSLM